MDHKAILEQGLRTIQTERDALDRMIANINDDFVRGCELLLDMQGRCIVSGMGKSGAVARKLAGTLASTGTPAHYMNPAEAVHGDLGMVTDTDVVIFLSNSGETDEVLNILPLVSRRGAKVIAICGEMNSSLARNADVALDAGVVCEACPLGLAPTASCVTAMALGDALAMAVMFARGFTTEDYAACHPGGTLGRRTLWRVRDVMHTGDEAPFVGMDATVLDAILTMSRASVRGAVCVVDEGGKMRGFFTDGDFRLLMQREPDRNAVMNRPITQVMTIRCTTAHPDMLAAAAARVMQEREFDNLPVVDDEGLAMGVVDIQDLLKLGIV
ncbi:MAG: KpsF/GutQ family sugar-phosphate isomerase [Armatimonadetes bacterium]|jgi:arabinose-5-phosphate isomerase|nr:KpsF/GutQ family sugar-phosphate isomerase [Armatimonadota bacterium]